jgi:hypothetical protein
VTVRSSWIASFDRVLPLGRFRSPGLPGGFGSVPCSTNSIARLHAGTIWRMEAK